MQLVLITALGVGGATVLGAVIGFIFKNAACKFGNLIISFSAGIMLSAAVLGLIIPATKFGGKYGAFVAVAGILTGAVAIDLSDKLVSHLHKPVISDNEADNNTVNRVLLFVIAIAIHNLPEGIAAGVGFGSGDMENALLIAGGIALHNVPEGMVIIAPMLAVKITPKRTFILAMITGLVEVAGTLLGYFAVSVATAILPFALAFAGGTMLYVISEEMMPEMHRSPGTYKVTYAFLVGFCVMLICDFVL